MKDTLSIKNKSEIIDPNRSHLPLSKGLNTLEGQIEMSSDQLIEQMNILLERAKTIQKKKKISEKIYNSNIGFEPIIKGIYYLYKKNNEQVISMISPNEWGRKINIFTYIAKIQLDYDHTWEILDLNDKEYFN